MKTAPVRDAKDSECYTELEEQNESEMQWELDQEVTA